MKMLLAIATAAAAVATPALAQSVPAEIMKSCAAFAPISNAERKECREALNADSEQFLADSKTPAGQRILTACEQSVVASWPEEARYVELRMCFRAGFKEEAWARIMIETILADVPEGMNSRRIAADGCMKKLDHGYVAVLACFKEHGVDVQPPPGNMNRLRQAFGE